MAKNTPTAWVGWIYFASVMMLLAGGMQIIAGLVAIFKDDFYLVTRSQLIALDFTAWGWVHLVLGILVVCAAFAAASGKTWGLMTGVVLAVMSALANLAFISAYPLWSIIAITIDVMVIYALTMHGTEARNVK